MKICAVICEYNPFHNGHFYQLSEIKKKTQSDCVLCIMSGNFTQRGDTAILDKYTRAKHAVLSGADIVIELPTVFATAPAEIFATGAINILSEIPDVKVLCFGTEKGDKQSFISTASALLNETKEFKSILKEQLKEGKSFAKARNNAIRIMNIDGVDLSLLESSNSILGLEYTKAIIKNKSDIEIMPLLRVGSEYNDNNIYENYSSASAIRETLSKGKKRRIKKNVPAFVYKDLTKFIPSSDDLIFYSLITKSPKELAEITDCTEGLENRIKALLKDSRNLDELTKKTVTKRYTKSRIKRIFLSSLLNIKSEFISRCLKSGLYIKVLAVDSGYINLLSYLSNNCKIPVIKRKSDSSQLNQLQSECFLKDTQAGDIYSFISGKKFNEYIMPVIEKNKQNVIDDEK